ncbi:MAG: flavodoxin family protein [Desulfobacteraceae bacterium]|nr:flavodoxin family protein [Desulfobacteraceae bacterium]
MKVIAFNGSPHKEGNTAILVNYVFSELEKEGIETELVQLAGKKIKGCLGCYKCFANKDQRCSVTTDDLNGCIEKMVDADGIILASPTYISSITSETKALMDRAVLVTLANDNTMLKRKVGAAVVAERRAGSMMAFNTLNQFFLITQMIIPASRYWNMGIGLMPGEVEKDEEGISIMKTLGENMAWLLKKINS